MRKVSITRFRISADTYLLEQGEVLQLLSTFPNLAGDHYELHQYHGGTVKAMLIILLVIFMAMVLCVVAMKRLCKAFKKAANPQVVASVAYAKKSQFPDI